MFSNKSIFPKTGINIKLCIGCNDENNRYCIMLEEDIIEQCSKSFSNALEERGR